jgi:murein DD-endopeptidase MepM/ murein hydrolase activator NlpD
MDTIDLDLENSLIIREIEMETEAEGQASGEGEIIFDRNLKVRGLQPARRELARKQTSPAPDLITELRKGDPRWHYTQYTIQKQDNLWRIAQQFEVSHHLIIRANEISNPDMLIPGKTLKIPNRKGLEHRVAHGDSLYALSRKYGSDVERIIEHNQVNPRALAIGSTLFIPDAAPRHLPARQQPARPVKPSHAEQHQTQAIAFHWPLRGKITSGFGSRKDPLSGKRKFHCGIDISVPEGTPIEAAASGTVIFSDWKTGYGKVVVLRHDEGYVTVYAHNSDNLVEKGDQVDSGQHIALSGKTGAVTGAHLHFEIRKYVTPLNPMRFLP